MNTYFRSSRFGTQTRARSLVVGLAAIFVAATSVMAQQAGTTTYPSGLQPSNPSSLRGGPSVIYQNTIRGGCVSGSTCITFDGPNGPDGGTITFPAVPTDALPIFGYLYFQYLTSTDCSVDTMADFANATINGVNINTLPFVQISCLNAQACFPQSSTHFYRVDISSLFQECDLNVATFEIRGFGMGNNTGTKWVEGATIMVAYCSETSPQTDVILLENAQVIGSGPDSTPAISYNWGGFNATGDNATLVLGIGNGQPAPEDVFFSTNSTPNTLLGNGSNDGLFDGDLCSGQFYDNTILNVSPLVNPGDSSATLTIVLTSDCLDSNAAFLCVESNSPPANCVPDACIASTGACCDRAVLNCLDFVAEDECLAPNEFFPSTLCADLDPTCSQPAVVPAVSEWGLLVLMLIGLVAATLTFGSKPIKNPSA